MAHVSDRRPELPNRQIPFSDAFKKFIVEGWAPHPTGLPDQLPAAEWARRRRELRAPVRRPRHNGSTLRHRSPRSLRAGRARRARRRCAATRRRRRGDRLQHRLAYFVEQFGGDWATVDGCDVRNRPRTDPPASSGTYFLNASFTSSTASLSFAAASLSVK